MDKREYRKLILRRSHVPLMLLTIGVLVISWRGEWTFKYNHFVSESISFIYLTGIAITIQRVKSVQNTKYHGYIFTIATLL